MFNCQTTFQYNLYFHQQCMSVHRSDFFKHPLITGKPFATSTGDVKKVSNTTLRNVSTNRESVLYFPVSTLKGSTCILTQV